MNQELLMSVIELTYIVVQDLESRAEDQRGEQYDETMARVYFLKNLIVQLKSHLKK